MPITCMVLSENGKYCALGYEDGKLSIVKSDSAEEIFSTKIVDFGSQITSLCW
jgi:hypothetical protein